MTVNEKIISARACVGDNQSARFCLTEAVQAQDRGDLVAADRWAVRSLMYSVGVFDKAYRKAARGSR